MRNNNEKIIKRITKKSLKANQNRNLFVVLAVMLTTILITTVFSIGISFMETNELQQIRFMGTTADARADRLTSAQIEKLGTLDYVEVFGQEFTASTVKNADDMSKRVELDLYWFEKSQWEAFRFSTNSDFVGTYPKQYGEIMAPLWSLEQLGIESPQVGMKIPIDYYLEAGNEDTLAHEVFTLSGYYTDYLTARSGGYGYLAVSEEFALASGNTTENDGSVSIGYKDSGKTAEYNERLAQDLALTASQEVSPWVRQGSSGIAESLSLIAFVGFIMLMAYLLIYNVLYISVSKDIRFYGLLKAIGTTPKQIKKIVTGQALRLAGVGIPIGLLVGGLLSVFLVPFVLGATLLGTEGSASFHPIIFIGAATFALLTTLISTVKPSTLAAKISPIEAMRHTEATVKAKTKKASFNGKLYVMAWCNVFRDKKRALIVLLSLFLGVTVFMLTSSLVKSYSFDSFISTNMPNDFVIENTDALWGSNYEEEKFGEIFMAEVAKLDGIGEISTVVMDKTFIQYEDKFSFHIDDFLQEHKYFDITREYIENNFTGFIIGVDTALIESINETSSQQIDLGAFERGEIAVVETDYPEHFDQIKSIHIETGLSGTNLELKIGGFIPWNRLNIAGDGAPNLIVSKNVLKKWSPSAPIGRLTFNVEDAFENEALEKLNVLIEDNPAIKLISKIETKNTMATETLMLSVLGTGLSVILGMIGVLNFVNIMVTSVMARRRELAMLESVGMTKKQIEKMLRFEGLWYWLLSIILVISLGSVITYGAFLLMRQSADFITFSYPLPQLLIATFVVFLVCAMAPKIAFNSINKTSVVERLRESE